MDSVLRLAPLSRWKFHYSRFYFRDKLLKHRCLIKWFFGHFSNDGSQVKQSCGVRCLKDILVDTVVVFICTVCSSMNAAIHFIFKSNLKKKKKRSYFLFEPCHSYWGFVLICISWSTWGRNMSNIVERWYLLLYLSTNALSSTAAFKQYSLRLLPGSKSCIMKSDMFLV